MKNFYLFIVLTAFFAGCTDDSQLLTPSESGKAQNTNRVGYDNGSIRALVPNPELLQKIIQNPGNPYERQFNFYPNGLLQNITDATGNIIDHFEYDGNSNLITCLSLGNAHTFTYDGNNKVTTVDGYPTTYDAVASKYIFNYAVPDVDDLYDYQHRVEIAVDANGYLISKKNFYDQNNEYHYTAAIALYQNGNMSWYGVDGGTTGQNYQFDNHENPLKTAMVSISRAMILTNAYDRYNTPWLNGEYTSINNISFQGYQIEDPETTQISYTYNSSGLPVVQMTQNYYNGTSEGVPYESFRYYYQGDVIP
jgi:hypothetical protein